MGAGDPGSSHSFFFGSELLGHIWSFTFKVKEDDDAGAHAGFDLAGFHHVLPHQGAKGECNVVKFLARTMSTRRLKSL